MLFFDQTSANFEAEFSQFLARPRGKPQEVDRDVRAILKAVREDGASALLDFARRFDKVELTRETLRVTPEEIEEGVLACSSDLREAIKLAASRIAAFHRRQMPVDQHWTDEAGVELGWRWGPLDSVGLYVPGGRAAYPSTVLMNAIPARVAGVERIAMVTPPGRLEPAVLAAAHAAGVSEIWRVGGAQAVAALAYGADPIVPVSKIVGPGNAYVTEAKRQLYGIVGIDALAGPSEIVVVADSLNPPEWIAADLLSQAEHDPDAQSILITDDHAFALAVCAAIEAQLSDLATGAVARQSWEAHGAVIWAQRDRSVDLVNRLAPEHVEFAVENPADLARDVRHAGAIFLGRYTPEAIGDYVAGSNHVLPTSRAARFQSGLSCYDFLKRTSVISCPKDSFPVLGRATAILAEAEGLPAHQRSAQIRL
jgi:histidinol dehydrogenase